MRKLISVVKVIIVGLYIAVGAFTKSHAQADSTVQDFDYVYMGIAPQGLLNKARVSAEKDLTVTSTIGGLLSYHYGSASQYQGPSLFLYYKYFLPRRAFKRTKYRTTYLIARSGVAYTLTPYHYDGFLAATEVHTTDYRYKNGEYSTGYGVGVGIGKRWRYNRWFIDLNLVVQYWTMTNTEDVNYRYSNNHYERYTFDYNYSVLSPGFIVSPTFIWGYVFK